MPEPIIVIGGQMRQGPPRPLQDGPTLAPAGPSQAGESPPLRKSGLGKRVLGLAARVLQGGLALGMKVARLVLRGMAALVARYPRHALAAALSIVMLAAIAYSQRHDGKTPPINEVKSGETKGEKPEARVASHDKPPPSTTPDPAKPHAQVGTASHTIDPDSAPLPPPRSPDIAVARTTKPEAPIEPAPTIPEAVPATVATAEPPPTTPEPQVSNLESPTLPPPPTTTQTLPSDFPTPSPAFESDPAALALAQAPDKKPGEPKIETLDLPPVPAMDPAPSPQPLPISTTEPTPLFPPPVKEANEKKPEDLPKKEPEDHQRPQAPEPAKSALAPAPSGDPKPAPKAEVAKSDPPKAEPAKRSPPKPEPTEPATKGLEPPVPIVSLPDPPQTGAADHDPAKVEPRKEPLKEPLKEKAPEVKSIVAAEKPYSDPPIPKPEPAPAIPVPAGEVGVAAEAGAAGLAIGAAAADRAASVADKRRQSKSEPALAGWKEIPNLGKVPLEAGEETETAAEPAEQAAGVAVAGARDPRSHVARDLSFEVEPTAGKNASSPARGRGPARLASTTEKIEATLHVVERQENFWTISRLYYGSGRYYKALWKANAAKCPRIDGLRVGDVIEIPAPEDLDATQIEPVTARSAASNVRRAAARTAGPGEPAPRRIQPRADEELVLPPARGGQVSRRDRSFAERDAAGGDDESTTTRSAARQMSASPTQPRRPVYKVRPDDTLRSIARDTLGSSRRAGEILDLNPGLVDESGRMTAGQLIELPDDARVAIRR